MTDSYVATNELLALIRRVFKALVVVTIVVGALGLTIGGIVYGMPGFWAALMAAVIGILFTASTVLGLYYAAGRGQEALMIVVVGGWLIKIVILGGAMLWLKGQTFYHKGTFVATIVTLVLAALIVEMVMVATARIPYVDVNSVTTGPDSVAHEPRSESSEAQQHAETEGFQEPGEGPGGAGV